jgi:ArsR family transcriptional regulator
MARPREQYEARARIAKALAHPTRLLLLDALMEEDLCVSEMTELAGTDQSTVSKHLAILRDAGFLTVEKKRAMSIFSIRCLCLDQFFECIETVLKENVRAQQDLVQL